MGTEICGDKGLEGEFGLGDGGWERMVERW